MYSHVDHYYRLSQTLNTNGLQRMTNLSIGLHKFLVISWSTNTIDEREVRYVRLIRQRVLIMFQTWNTDTNKIGRSLKLRMQRVWMRDARNFCSTFFHWPICYHQSLPINYMYVPTWNRTCSEMTGIQLLKQCSP